MARALCPARTLLAARFVSSIRLFLSRSSNLAATDLRPHHERAEHLRRVECCRALHSRAFHVRSISAPTLAKLTATSSAQTTLPFPRPRTQQLTLSPTPRAVLPSLASAARLPSLAPLQPLLVWLRRSSSSWSCRVGSSLWHARLLQVAASSYCVYSINFAFALQLVPYYPILIDGLCAYDLCALNYTSARMHDS